MTAKLTREQCNLLASQIFEADSGQVASLLKESGFPIDKRDAATSEDSGNLEGPVPISIWVPELESGQLSFRRRPPLPLGDHFAVRELIPARPLNGEKRICFFGESVAAGYLYAPFMTPAAILQHQLDQNPEDGRWDVIDLARTNETLDSLLNTVEQSLQLAPDLLVIFIGNNWNLLETPEASAYAPSYRARQQFAANAQVRGLEGAIDQAGRNLARKAINSLDRLARLAGNIPVMFLVPEVNLLDWESRQPVSWLPADGVARWYHSYNLALEHLERKSFGQALDQALEMLALDKGTCPTTFRLMARAYLGQDKIEKALEASQAEVDSAYYASICFLEAPRATSMVRRILKLKAEQYQFPVIDLRSLFQQAGLLPDRNLFVDYCHLTAKGMGLVMKAVAARILDRPEIETRDLPLEPAAEATALFGAAIHSAHRLVATAPPLPALVDWCRKALAIDPGIRAAMLDFVAVRTTDCPAVLTAAQQHNLNSHWSLKLQHGWKYDFFDGDVIRAIREALADDASSVKKIDKMLQKQGLGKCWTNLFPYFLACPLEQFYPELLTYEDLTRHFHFRSPWPETSFYIVGQSKTVVCLEVTARCPFRITEGLVDIQLNGKKMATLAVRSQWHRQQVTLVLPETNHPLNLLTLVWPMPEVDGLQAWEQALKKLEAGRQADLHPVFGEISRIRVRLTQGPGN